SSANKLELCKVISLLEFSKTLFASIDELLTSSDKDLVMVVFLSSIFFKFECSLSSKFELTKEA
ncbi:MAG: hypothetical protein GX282_06230, partial [Campylobacteraceae bacterium]|nr:hypothetical protein [Campylobacteraceae bacterium]